MSANQRACGRVRRDSWLYAALAIAACSVALVQWSGQSRTNDRVSHIEEQFEHFSEYFTNANEPAADLSTAVDGLEPFWSRLEAIEGPKRLVAPHYSHVSAAGVGKLHVTRYGAPAAALYMGATDVGSAVTVRREEETTPVGVPYSIEMGMRADAMERASESLLYDAL